MLSESLELDENNNANFGEPYTNYPNKISISWAHQLALPVPDDEDYFL